MARGNGATAQAQPPAPVQQQTEIQPARERPKDQPTALKALLDAQVDRIAESLPEGITPKRMISVVSTLNYRNPDLQKCDPKSILAATLQGAALGLDFSPTMGEAYLIPRWNKNIGGLECQFQPGYRGLVKLARNSGMVKSIRAELVYERDVFAYEFRPDLYFIHQPYAGADRGKVVRVYAVAKTVHGEHLITVMTRDEVEEIHQRSDNARNARKNGKAEFGPWVSDWGEMAKKTVLKRLAKTLPMSTEMADAIEADNTEYAESVTGNVRLAPNGPTRGIAGLRGQLGLDQPREPSPSVVYSEADEPEALPPDDADPDAGPMAAADAERFAEDGWGPDRE